nr:holliday junction resolvase [uncultured bacterium]
MGSIIAIDYGEKRTGLAHTDPNKIIATGLCTLATEEVVTFLKDHAQKNEVDVFVVGYPQQKDGTPSAIEESILLFISKLRNQLPNINIERYSERFTTKIAKQTLGQIKLKKKDRNKKGLLDEISATLILQSYLTYQSR